MTRRTLGWWAKCLLHNCLAHPLLPLGYWLQGSDRWYLEDLGDLLCVLHDDSAEMGEDDHAPLATPPPPPTEETTDA